MHARATFPTLALAVAAAALAGPARAVTLEFDALTSSYASFASYVEDGFLVELVTTSGALGHIGDATGNAGTLNWHNGGDNGDTAYVRLTQVGGGSFSLLSFDWMDFSAFSVAAGGWSATLPGAGGTYAAPAMASNVSVVEFRASMNGGQIDNVTLGPASAVPEPEAYGLMLAGLALVGAARRRRALPAAR